MQQSRYESWLDEQSTVTSAPEGGANPCTIILEFDGERWGTWSAKTANLGETVRQSILRLAEELPRGGHSGYLSSLDDAGQVLSRQPVVIHGNSTAAKGTVDPSISLQRAMTIAVGNMESLVASSKSSVECLTKQNEAYLEQNMVLIQALQESIAAKAEGQVALERQQAKDARLAVILEKLTPMIDIGLAYVGVKVEERFGSKNKLEDHNHGEPSRDFTGIPPVPPVPPVPPPPIIPPAPIVVDLAAFDAQPSLGGSRKGRKKPAVVAARTGKERRHDKARPPAR